MRKQAKEEDRSAPALTEGHGRGGVVRVLCARASVAREDCLPMAFETIEPRRACSFFLTLTRTLRRTLTAEWTEEQRERCGPSV